MKLKNNIPLIKRHCEEFKVGIYAFGLRSNLLMIKVINDEIASRHPSRLNQWLAMTVEKKI
jgi:hypothetical protein